MRRALVTGASRAMGAAIAQRLAADGWSVAVNDNSDHEGAAQVVGRIASAGGHAVAAPFDVTDPAQIGAGLGRVAELLSPVDLIVNNATGPQRFIPIMEQSWHDYLDQLTFLFKAPLDLLQSVLSDWRSRGSGRIINIGPEVVELGNPELTHYVTAKGAMLGMTRSLPNELGSDGICVNLVAPGLVPGERHAGVPLADKDSYLDRTAFGRFVGNEDVAEMVAFLASPAASNITGQKFSVNAGRTLL